MAPADWDSLRFDGGSVSQLLGGNCQAGPLSANYSSFPAKVTIDGQAFSGVSVRKKGFLGSQSVSKPSLKVKLDEKSAPDGFHGVTKLTLNNNKQDPSLIRTCLAFAAFKRAGVAASRCNFAHVTVNGQDLGIYSNVEAVTEPFLAREFGDSSGNLYEGQLSDLRAGWTDTYQKQTNTTDTNRSDLTALADALLVGDAEVLARVQALLDLDEFLDYWVMEAILASWDSYSTTQNNHLMYHDMKSGKFRILPWGPDLTFAAEDPLNASTRPQSISAWGAISNRLYRLPEIRTRYRDRLLMRLDSAFAPDPVLAEIDRMQQQLQSRADDTGGQFTSALKGIRDFVTKRKETILREVENGPAPWTTGLNTNPCVHTIGNVQGTFMTKMGTADKADPFSAGTGTLKAMLGATMETGDTVGSAAGRDNLYIQIQTVAVLPNGQFRVAVLFVDRSLFIAGTDIPIDSRRAFAVYGNVDLATRGFIVIGLMDKGTVHLDQASMDAAAPISGNFHGDIFWTTP